MYKVALLASLPLLMNGIASYFLVPLSIALGRRPVLLFVGVMAWAGGFWASYSTSLPSHLAARAFQGLGAGAVEALIPLIVQDMMFIHQRNKAISLISAGQGLFVVSLGVARYVCLPFFFPLFFFFGRGQELLSATGIVLQSMMLTKYPVVEI